MTAQSASPQPPQLVPINDEEALKAAGLSYPTREHQARWLYRNRKQNGLAGGFVKIGRRIFIDPARFVELARQQAS